MIHIDHSLLPNATPPAPEPALPILASHLLELEELHQTYAEKGLTVLGFPCSQFANQEYSAPDRIAEVCQVNFGVTFAMHSLIDVNGENAHPLFQQLKTEAPGLLGSKGIKWNFTKFLVNRDGEVLKRFGPKFSPSKMVADIEQAL